MYTRRTYEVVVQLDLYEHVIEQHTRRGMRQLADRSTDRLDRLLAHSLHDRLDLLLGVGALTQQRGMLHRRVVLPARVQAIAILVRIVLEDVPQLLGHAAIAVHEGERGQQRDIENRQHVVVETVVLVQRLLARVQRAVLDGGVAQSHHLVHQNGIMVQVRSEYDQHR